MKEIDFLYKELNLRYGPVLRARKCFLYTKKSVRITDMFQENGKAILGWGNPKPFTQFKNTMNRGITGSFYTEYENRIINLHPALLPKFGGVGMWGHHVHEAVLAAKETESGCTVHFVDGGCDTGKIIVQKKVPVLEGDTPDSLYARIAPEEHKAIVEGTCILAEMLNK